MNKITWLTEYTKELKEYIEPINFHRVVIDDSELVLYLQDLRKSDNMILMAVIPEISTQSRDEDNFLLRASHSFLVLEKTSESNMRYDDGIEMWERTYQAAEDIVRKMMEDKTAATCTFLRRLNPSSITISPVWKKASTNGWMITYSLDMLL